MKPLQLFNYIFADPEFFILLILIPLMIAWFIYQEIKRKKNIKISTGSGFQNYTPTFRQRLIYFPFILRVLIIFILIICLARPQTSSYGQNVLTEGIDIVLAIDVSGSMLAEDFKPNRIESAKKVAEEFVTSRPTDRIGLVIFSGESLSLCPITTDHAVLLNQLKEVRSGMLEDGTAIGDGLGTAINRIKDSKAKSKVIILLTDGVNNIGSIAPATAGEIAEKFGIRVYTIGVGTKGMAPYPVQTPFGVQYQNMEVQIDEALLQQIATSTGGEYFRATNNKKLENIYAQISKMEKTKVELTEYRHHKEEYFPFALLAGCLLIMEIFLRYTVFKTLP